MKKLLFFLLALMLLSACKDRSDDDAEKLPDATQTGANKAGCYINGQLHLPKDPSQPLGGPPILGRGIECTETSNGKYFRINNYQKKIYLFIYLADLSGGIGNYTINQSAGVGAAVGNQNQMYLEYNSKEYISGPNSGVFTVTKLSPPITSGTFNATLYNKANPSETIQITDGRIDINTQTLNK